MGTQLRATLKPLDHYSTIVLKGYRVAFSWSPMMPRDASLSDSSLLFLQSVIEGQLWVGGKCIPVSRRTSRNGIGIVAVLLHNQYSDIRYLFGLYYIHR